MSKPDPLSWTLRFKKHKTTVLLMLPAQESLLSTKEKLHRALQARKIAKINGDPLPENPADIEFGVPIDRNELEKGWTRLGPRPEEDSDDSLAKGKKPVGRPKQGSLADSLQAADVRDGQAIAFRFRRSSVEAEDDELDAELEDPGWDVVVPSLDDDEELE